METVAYALEEAAAREGSNPLDTKKGTRLGITPLIESMPTLTAHTSSQNCLVRIASPRVKFSSVTALLPAECPGSPGRPSLGEAPSGSKPTSSGDLMMRNEAGTRRSIRATPVINQVSRQPKWAIRVSNMMGKNNAPEVEPPRAVAWAIPRRRTNHLGTARAPNCMLKRPIPPRTPKTSR